MKKTFSATSPEAQLILACARTELDAATSQKLNRLLQQQLDWDYVLRKANEHSIVPLLCRNLEKFPQAVPEDIMGKLQTHFSAHARRNLFFTSELLKLLSLLEGNGIRAVAYKGPVLSATAYGNVVLRSFVDLDLLVHEEDVLRAKAVLIANGFQTRDQLTTAQEQAHLRSRHRKDIVFFRPGLPISVELHWRVASLFLFPLDSEQLWQRLETITLAGKKVSNITPEDMLLILCVHGAKHSFKRLQWICDIAELVKANPQLNWVHVLVQAAELRCVRMLSLGLLLATNLLGTTLPTEVRLVIESERKVKSLASRVLKSLFRVSANASYFAHEDNILVNLKEEWIDETRLRIRYYFHKFNKAVTPNSRDKKLVPLPALLSFLYYLVRPIRLANTYGRALLMQRLKH